jgi:hypothetical protein
MGDFILLTAFRFQSWNQRTRVAIGGLSIVWHLPLIFCPTDGQKTWIVFVLRKSPSKKRRAIDKFREAAAGISF